MLIVTFSIPQQAAIVKHAMDSSVCLRSIQEVHHVKGG